MMTTDAPSAARLGVNEVMRGADGSGMNVKPFKVELPAAFTTFTAPETTDVEI